MVKFTHPLTVALGQVIIDGNNMHAFTGKRIQVYRQCRNQRLTFARFHFGDITAVKDHAA